MEKHLGQLYQQKTKYSRSSLEGRKLDWDNRPDSFKEYDGEYLILPGPLPDDGKSLWQSLRERKSVRKYTGEKLSPEELNRLLWAVNGTTRGTAPKDFYFRTAPSAGGLYPVETYIQINRVRDFKPGIYHYSVPKHGLHLLQEGEFGSSLAGAALDQPMVENSAVNFLWTAVTSRTFWKYGQRGIRYIYMDAGHVGQNLYLAAAALDLGCCVIGAFFDDEVNKLLGVDGEDETIVYMASVGRP
ncbi:SagB-type dehydrogenase domain-containing protein [Desulfotomaculum arcticum]|uniref:SagB-type dehydrogenase domain-containing protein n=1 Tax=Desulfotruncus arcticus DSM 17038 TaxID=1121424 RepID=A0A1I2YML5_9FIRM|nr:SagB/ThcOx family dehydrogenase [Desulfotruncus arcticus]SFH26787.1 SagB-type dehydrogenase domain-containing protein [Desulfotomaculum arcticum] [Desulfotruncus arcticus DSM 17038]